MNPMEEIVAFNRSVKESDEQLRAAYQLSDAIGRMYSQIGGHIEEVAALSRKYGKANLLARLPANVAGNIDATLTGIVQAWTALGDSTKLPAMPDHPEESAGE